MLTRRLSIFIGIVLPATFCVVYGLTLWLLPRDLMRWVHSEYGPIEIGTALVFLVIAGLAAHLTFRLSVKPQAAVPRIYRVWFALFILGGLFMCLEEISYGQTFFQWESPRWFAEHSKQQETNLHNLFGDKPSSMLRRIAEIGLPILAILLPLLFMRHPRGYQPDHFSYYLLPRWETAGWVVLALATSPVRKSLDRGGPGDNIWDGTISETKELLWALALWAYIVVMRQRLLGAAKRQAIADATREIEGVAR